MAPTFPVAIAGSRLARRDRRVYVEQHGCSTTEGEAAVLRGLLEAGGHRLVDALGDADTAVLVTCAVVERTEREMLKRIEAMRNAVPDLVVSGCMASSRVPEIKRAAPGALVLPPQYLHQVGDLLDRGTAEFCYAPKVGLPKRREGAIETVVVNEGCSGRCTFCLTKIARPGLRSYPLSGIVDDVRAAVAHGAREIRLTSQDSGAYGLDSGTDLPALLRSVSALEGEFRVRIGMLNPFALDRILDPLIGAMAHPKVFKFLHLPVQSGSSRVLEAMGRLATADDARRQGAAVRAAFPDLFLATDAIVGFPGETEEDHRETIRLLRDLAPDVIHVTRFSAREGTPALALHREPGRVEGRFAKRRSRELTALRWEIAGARFARWVGEEVEAFVVEPGTRPGTSLARTDEYRQVVLGDAPLGARVRVRILGAKATHLLGEVLGPVA